jgi:hypothetical protein
MRGRGKGIVVCVNQLPARLPSRESSRSLKRGGTNLYFVLSPDSVCFGIDETRRNAMDVIKYGRQ